MGNLDWVMEELRKYTETRRDEAIASIESYIADVNKLEERIRDEFNLSARDYETIQRGIVKKRETLISCRDTLKKI